MKTPQRRHTPDSRQAGLTLIEIMIAMTISLVLLAGVIQIFVSNKKTYRMQEAASQIQEGGRFAVQMMNHDLRMAGYFGCISLVASPANRVDLDGDGVADSTTDFTGRGLQGYEYSDLPITISNSQTLTTAEVLPNTDIISIARGEDMGIRLVGNLTNVNANIQLDAALAAGRFQANDTLIISDCNEGDIFAATNVSNGSGKITIAHSSAVNTGNFLSKAYGPDAEVMALVNHIYFIGTGSSGQPSLFRYALGNNGVMTAEELVEGVEDMQVTYGEDTDGDQTANVYVDASAVSDMSQVVSIRIDYTLRSLEDNIIASASASASASTSGDRRLRRSFSAITTIRNRVQ
ncbi:MAG TPA: prepilin-type N-terminal cleavage/methylation domain-containing protein [Gammaproteobacteria bacterium]|nr:prepilin-type N-terminal cleavage/methylation domain-containing protein [Gammaproteobacteria bacterium]